MKEIIIIKIILFYLFFPIYINSTDTCDIDGPNRIDCGADLSIFNNMKTKCLERGCCYSALVGYHFCYHPLQTTSLSTMLFSSPSSSSFLTTEISSQHTISININTIINTEPVSSTNIINIISKTEISNSDSIKSTKEEIIINDKGDINYINDICKMELNEKNKTIVNDCFRKVEEEIIGKQISTQIFDVVKEMKKDIIFQSDNFVIQLTTSENQKTISYDNISTIILSDCEKILKKEYNISENESLIILKQEFYENNYLTPNIVYKIFHPITHEVLNLDYCKNTTISLEIPAKLDENNLNIYNLSSEYYTDRCYPADSDKNTDITLDDRVKNFVNNKLSVCEINCEYQGYNKDTKKVICDCEVKNFSAAFSEDRIDQKVFWSRFKNLKQIINIEVIKCYYTFFTKNGFLKNIGNFIIIVILILYIIETVYFIIKGYDKFKIKITKIISRDFPNKVVKTSLGILNNKDKKKAEKINRKLKTNENKKNLNESKLRNHKKIKNTKNPPKKESITIKKKRKNKFNFNNKSFKDSSDKYLNNTKPKNTEFLKVINKKNINNNISKIYNDYELNYLSYKEALQIDRRLYCEYYISLLKTKHLIINTFFYDKDYNSQCLKICLFLFIFSLFTTVNTLFFNDSTMHDIYESKGKYKILYRLPQIIYSTIISSSINILIKLLSLSEKNVVRFKRENFSEKIDNIDIKKNSLFKHLKIKFILFYIFSFLLMIFFWYYISCFCAVYKNTQIPLIKDTLTSFILSLIYPFLINLAPGILRIPSLKTEKGRYIYNISYILQLI